MQMTIKAIMTFDKTLDTVDYHKGVLQAKILPVSFSEGKRTKPYPSVSTLYPVIIDVNDDNTIRSFEIFIGASSWKIEKNLKSPINKQIGRICINEVNDENHYPFFRLNPIKRIVFIDAQEARAINDIYHVQTADKVIMSISSSSEVVGIWLLDVPAEVVEIGLAEASKTHNT